MAKTTTTSAPLNSPGRVITASMIGTTIEFYDFYVYATAAVLVFPQLFFKTGNPTTALLASFAVFGAAMVARPIGAIFFGHLGDRRGPASAPSTAPSPSSGLRSGSSSRTGCS
jgi:MFS family permease